MVIVPRMLAKTAYDWPFEICEMDDPRPKMVLCTAGVAFEDADAEHIGLTAYLKAYDAAHAESSVPVASEVKAVPQSEVEDKAVAGPSEVKAEQPTAEPTIPAEVPAEAPSDPEHPGVNFPPEARRQRGR